MKYPKCVNLKDRIVVVGKDGERRGKVLVTCPNCGETRHIQRVNINYGLKKNTFTGLCHICRTRQMGKRYGKLNRREKNGKWKGGRYTDSSGYGSRTIQPDNPFFCMADSNNRVLEHRLIVAIHLRRPLLSDEHVHHIDGNKTNNNIENLVLMSSAKHHQFERLLQIGELQREDILQYIGRN